jgi:hypothetical protein
LNPISIASYARSLDAAYVAGFFDGEGGICIHRSRPCVGRNGKWYRRQPHLGIALSNKRTSVLRGVARIFGGNIHINSKTGVAEWQVANQKALSFLEWVYPHLVTKANPAWIAICFQRLHKKAHRGHPISPSQNEAYEAAREIMIKINGRNLRLLK